MKKTIFLLVLAFTFLANASASASYYSTSVVPCGAKGTLCTICDFVKMGVNVYKYILAISLAAAVLFIVIGGIMYIISSGSEEKIKGAKTAIKYALIGFGMCLLSWVLVNITVKALGYTTDWSNLGVNCTPGTQTQSIPELTAPLTQPTTQAPQNTTPGLNTTPSTSTGTTPSGSNANTESPTFDVNDPNYNSDLEEGGL